MVKIDEYILLEDENLVVLNKPPGLLTIPDREGKEVSLKRLLQAKYGDVFTVHRLDKETSGVVVFAKNEATHKMLSLQFENRETKKIYNGLVLGSPLPLSGVVNEPIAEHPSRKGVMTVHKKGKESSTEYEQLERFRLFSWMRFRILTGRTHQIRVHMKFLGHPVVCDNLYGDGKPVFISQIKSRYKLSQAEEEERPILNRLALHSSLLLFRSLDGKDYDVEAPLPKDLGAVLNQLGKQNRK